MTKTVSLGEICVKIISGGTPSTEKPEFWGGSIPWITSADIKDHYTATARKFLTEKAGVDVLPAGNILVVTRVGLGKLVVNQQPLAFSQDLQGLILKPNVDRNYLVYVLSQRVKRFKEISRGATIKGVTRDDLVKIKLPLPALPRQRQIAAILDLADALRQKDRQLLEYYDQLAQSTFLDLFGNPVRNEKEWEVKRFRELGKLDRGVSKHRPRNDPKLLGGIYPLIQTGDVANAGGYISRYKSTYSAIGLRQSKMWKAGTLCITIAANIAKTSILKLDACFPDSIVGFTPNSEYTNSEFIRFWLSFLQKTLEDAAPESAQKNINLEILRELIVPAPPLPLQQHFATIIERIERQKAVVRQQMAASEALFQRLLQDSFGD